VVTDLQLERAQRAILQQPTAAKCDDFALFWFFCC
jgi:hypothetical protein